MLRALALLFLAPLLGAANSEARGDDWSELPGQVQAASQTLFIRAKALPGEDLAILAGYAPHSLVLAVPVFASSGSYRLCLLYDYARAATQDPISAWDLADYDGNRDARNLGLGLRALVTERLEFEAVVGHSHANGATNSAYAGLIYDVDGHLGLGADLGRISANGQDDHRLRAFARFYF